MKRPRVGAIPKNRPPFGPTVGQPVRGAVDPFGRIDATDATDAVDPADPVDPLDAVDPIDAIDSARPRRRRRRTVPMVLAVCVCLGVGLLPGTGQAAPGSG